MNVEFRKKVPQADQPVKETAKTVLESFHNVGEKITIGDREHIIERVSLASELGREFGLHIPDDVPIYWLSDSGIERKGAFVPKKKIVLFFHNTDAETQHHELTHAVEYFVKKRPGLVDLYEQVKSLIAEDSFEGDFVTFNFMKNIHEFIADGRTKQPFIAALKKEGFYEDFLRETAYLFKEAENGKIDIVLHK